MGDIRTTAGEEMPSTRSERSSRLLRNLAVALLIAAIVVATGFLIRVPKYAAASGYATTSVYAETRSATTGRISEILVFSGDDVKAGDPLVRLEDDAERAAVGEARSQVAEAESRLSLKSASVAETLRAHNERLRLAELELSYAEEQLKLTRLLHDKGLVSGRKLSDDEFGVTRSRETLRSLRETDLTIGQIEIDVLKQELATKREALERAEAALRDRTIRAPIAGRAFRYTFYVGELLRPDMVLYEVFDGEVNLLKLRVPERYAARVKPGQRVKLRLGTYRTLIPTRFYGQVEAMRDVVEGSGDNNYRVVYCSFDRKDWPVAPGTSANARIRIGRVSLWSLIFQP